MKEGEKELELCKEKKRKRKGVYDERVTRSGKKTLGISKVREKREGI